MTRTPIAASLAFALFAPSAFAAPTCPVQTKGPEGTKYDSWAEMHQGLTGKAAASEAAAVAALCGGSTRCGGDLNVHVLDDDASRFTLVLQGAYEAPAGKPYYVAFTHIDKAMGFMEDRIDWTVKPLGAFGEWVQVHGVSEIIGREEFCDGEGPDADCRTASVNNGYETIDLAFHNQSFAFGARCGTEKDVEPKTGITYVDGRFGYTDCARSTPQWFKIPHQGGCAPIATTLADPKATLKAARAAAAKKDWKASLAAFDQLVDSDPANGAWRSERGYVRYKSGDLFNSEADFRAVLKAPLDAKTKGKTLYNLGLVLDAQGQPQDALAAFEASEAARPHKAARKRIAKLKAVLSK